MNKRMIWLAALAAAAAAGVGGTVAAATTGGDDGAGRPITGADLERAKAAALEHTGGGTVTGTEVGDEESRYEVEVRMDNGRSVDVQLDETFTVVGQEAEGSGEDEGGR